MSAVFLDGFDHYGTGTVGAGNMLDGAWAEATNAGPGVPDWGTRTGLYSLLSSTPNNGYRYVLPATETELFLSMGYSVDGLPKADLINQIASFRTSGNVTFATIWCQADGSIALTDGSNPPNILATSQGPVIVSRNWHFLEMDIDATGNTFTLRIDDATGSDTPTIDATSLGFTSPTVGQLYMIKVGSGGSEVPNWMDDLFVRNTSGSVNNSWLGDRRIATLFANSDTAVAGWTPSYYHKFGAGILTLGYVIPNDTSVHNSTAAVTTAAAASLDIGANDFTLETLVRFDKLPSAAAYSAIFNRWDTSANGRSFRLVLGGSSFNNSCLQFDTSTDGTTGTVSTPIVYPWAPQLNTWYAVSICRSAGELLLFVDGQQLGVPIADSSTYYSGGVESMSIGAEYGAGGVVASTNIAGRLDETRFTNGTGRYTATYTPAVAAFPRGGSDPYWAQVVWLMGYDSGVVDESSFVRTVVARNGAVSFLPSDGPDVGAYSTINKANPDDNTFISAALLNATNVLTMTTQPANTNTVTVGTKDGSTPAVYTFKTVITTAFDVLIDTTAQGTLTNLLNAINAGAGSGTKYGAGTTSNFDVNGTALPPGQIEVTANLAGTGGNSIPSTATGSAASWLTSTLTGGAAIPGPSDFLLQRPPNNTTVISALQTTVRARKTDSGLSTIQTSFIGPLGGIAAGSPHNLSISSDYYSDIVELDPDTSGPISPTTIINGKIKINRTA